jgi:hyperosmotically inducible periplasmic protein
MKWVNRYVAALVFASFIIAGCAPTATSRDVAEVADDATVTARVKTALIRQDDVKARDINVNTFRGVVQLSGFVESPQMAQLAVQEARRVPGVVAVENKLSVQPRR